MLKIWKFIKHPLVSLKRIVIRRTLDDIISGCEKSIDNIEIIEDCATKINGTFTEGWKDSHKQFIVYIKRLKEAT
ncbi:MAG: hypothetical protein GY820_38505 [Gammaproteobacteria bacterium]|nr:hypothetical protein [Gammaproteobacteria bacterium]